MPVVVADLGQRRGRPAVVAEIGDGVDQAVARRRRVAADMLLDLAELPREGELCVPAQVLVAEDQHVMRAERVADALKARRRQRPAEIGADDLHPGGRRQAPPDRPGLRRGGHGCGSGHDGRLRSAAQ